jgi:radical SAM protein with 4Fe4S-binding SPASM domain
MYPAIKTNTTFSPWIVGRMDELVRYLQDDVGVDAVRMQHLWFTDKPHAEAHKKVMNEVFGTNEKGVDSHIISSFEPDYVKKLAEEVVHIERSRYSKPVFVHPRLTKEQIVRYYTDQSFKKNDCCFVAWNSMVVKANGDVMFCPDEWISDFKLGNVRSSSIKEMWNSEKAGKFREELYKRKLFPACARCCVVNG